MSKKEKTGKNAPRQRAFDGRERVNANWKIFKDQDVAIRDLAKETTDGNVQVAVRSVFDKYFGLPKEKEEE